MWFFHFTRLTHEARQAAHKVYRSGPMVKGPTFGDMATFFGLCVWITPLFLFLSLSANDNTLPMSGEPSQLLSPGLRRLTQTTRFHGQHQLAWCCFLPAATPLLALPLDVRFRARTTRPVLTKFRRSHRPDLPGYAPALVTARARIHDALHDAVADTISLLRRCSGTCKHRPYTRLLIEPSPSTENVPYLQGVESSHTRIGSVKLYFLIDTYTNVVLGLTHIEIALYSTLQSRAGCHVGDSLIHCVWIVPNAGVASVGKADLAMEPECDRIVTRIRHIFFHLTL